MTELSDELLVAYVDGQLAAKQSSAIEKVLAHDDVIARRVKAMKKAHRRLEAAFDAILAGEEADAASHPLPPSPGLLIPWSTLVKCGLAVAGIFVAAILFIAGFGLPLATSERNASGPGNIDHVGSLAPDWREEVARAQALLGRASLEIGLDSQGNRDFVAIQLGRAIGAAIAPPDLGAKGYRFARAQILRFDDEPLGAAPLSWPGWCAACALRQEGRSRRGAGSETLWSAGRRGVVARRRRLFPRRRARGGLALEFAEAIRKQRPALATAPCGRRACSRRQGSD